MSYKKCCQNVRKSACFKCKYGLCGYDYRVASLPNLGLTVIEITMQSLKSIKQF